MKRISKMLAAIVGAGFLVVIGAMFAPRTVHAFAATLVQVVNTTTTTMPVVQAPASSMLYSQTCTAYFTSMYGPFTSCTFSAIPEGMTLVSESLSIYYCCGPPPTVGLFAPPSFQTDLIQYVPTARIFIPLMAQADNNYDGASAARVYFHRAPMCLVSLGSQPSQYDSIVCSIGGYLVPTT